jgi:thymidylate synthase (FAD)
MSNNITFRSDFLVDLIQHAGDDEMICKAARVSVLGAASIDSKESAGLINFLMANRHGSPFEHAMITARITAPIAVWREFMRHRIGVSYNEESGRYKQLDGVFYLPPKVRKLVQVGKAGQYTFEHGDESQKNLIQQEFIYDYQVVWNSYTKMLDAGIAKEVARFILPVGIYSTAYVTMNPRSIMNFLSLRTKHEDATFPSFPMWEINQTADKIEELFKELFPITHQAFVNNGRVAP